MKTFCFILLTNGFALLFSCNKPSSDSPATLKVKTVTHDGTLATRSVTHNIIYNSNDEIIGTETIPVSGTHSSYQAIGNKYSYRYYSDDFLFLIRDAFVKPGTKVVDSVYEINASLEDTLEIKFHYNSADQVTSSDEINHSRFGVDITTHTDYTYDADGKIIQELFTLEGGSYTKSYFYSIPVPVVSYVPDGYFPRIQKQLPTKIVFEGMSLDNEVFNDFTFDSLNRLSTITITSLKYPGQVNTTAYTYY
jgi:hypothetical protein